MTITYNVVGKQYDIYYFNGFIILYGAIARHICIGTPLLFAENRFTKKSLFSAGLRN